MKQTDLVREHARKKYVEPAQHRHAATFQIVVGDVQRDLQLHNRTPLICSALRSRKFLAANHLVLEKWEGPPSGMSTTVTLTYRLEGDAARKAMPVPEDRFISLRGILKDTFQNLGGGEAFIRKQREHFYEPEKDS